MELSEKLKRARISCKITQKTLAERLGISRTTLSLWESGKVTPPIVYIRKYQEIFNFEKGYFDTVNDITAISDTLSFDVSLLNPMGRRKLEDFYISLLKKEEYLKKT